MDGWRGAQAFAALAALALAACTTPAARIEARAAAGGFFRAVVDGDPYRHLVYGRSGRGSALHVYIEHDGSPWVGNVRVAADPTPRRPLMLELMSLDERPVLYLGRPCYFGMEDGVPCSPAAWTNRRYGPEVVASMAAALGQVLARWPHRPLVFFGHSGGGTLAVLLAERFPQTAAVVTVGANLDVARWVRLHGYSALSGSLDPRERPPLSRRVVQRHYVGSRDATVPPALVRGYARGRPGAQVIEVPGFDHVCCWLSRWRAILADLERTLGARGASSSKSVNRIRRADDSGGNGAAAATQGERHEIAPPDVAVPRPEPRLADPARGRGPPLPRRRNARPARGRRHPRA